MYSTTHHGVSDSVFDRLKQTLFYIAEQKAARKVMVPKITLRCVVLRQNIEDLCDFARFAVEVKANEVRYKSVDAVDDPGVMNVVPMEEQLPASQVQFEKAREYLTLKKIPFVIYKPTHVVIQTVTPRPFTAG